MPARPPVNMGMYDPTSERYREPGKMQLVKMSKAEEEMSKTAREVELRLQQNGETLRLPAQVSTTVWDIKLFLADRLGKDPGDFTFIAKQGPFWRENKDCEEMRPKVVVKGLKSFERERFVHEDPIVVIGAGHIGLRQAMVFLKYKESNFVIFDRKEKVGGMAWWDQANVTSKLQTEYGVYHLGWDESIPTPTEDYPWPSRDELLKMFQKGAEEYGIIPYCRLGTDVKEVKAEGQKLDIKYEVLIQNLQSKKVGDFFRGYDSALKGYLSVEQFRPLYDSLVEQGEVQECYEKVIEQVDSNGDGQVSLNEFIKWYAETWETTEEGEGEDEDPS